MNNTNKFNLTEKDLVSPGVVKMTHNSNIELIEENTTLKKSLETIQNGFNTLRIKFNKLESDNKILKIEYENFKNNTRYDILLEIGQFILTIFIAIFTNLVTSHTESVGYWLAIVFLSIAYIFIAFYKNLKNK
ncbi:MAG: hypothetical protein PHQ95_00375 [Candidatus Gracilibacteria bacterium]|nr:hypothetical protein [Candidatus Gracilibacteria bacterium]